MRADFIAYAKANPGKLAIASAGNGAASHLACESLNDLARIDLLHLPDKVACRPPMARRAVKCRSTLAKPHTHSAS